MRTYQHEVKYYECDRMGITHHSNYVRFMEEARVDWMDQLGYGFDRMEAEGVVSPVVEVQWRSFSFLTSFPALRPRLVGLSVDGAAVGFLVALDTVFAVCSPLLEEERNTLLLASAFDVQHPFLLHRSRLVAALAADNDPVDAGEVEGTEVGEERLTRKEAHCFFKDANSRQQFYTADRFCIFHRCSDPHITRNVSRQEKSPHFVCPLGEELEGVLLALPYRSQHRFTVLVRHVLMEEV